MPLLLQAASYLRSRRTGRYDDVPADIVDVAEDIVVPEAEDRPAERFQLSCSITIAACNRFSCVLQAINFDDQLLGRTGKIHDVARNRHLPPEPKAHQAVSTKLIPKL